MKLVRIAMAAAASLIASAPGHAQEAAPAAADYSNSANWLCLPGRSDACAQPLPTAALNANGYGSVGRSTPAAAPAIDCFYVYPTVSRDTSMNSDLQPGPEEQAVAMVQFARFHEVCRTFAPLYRQVTLAGLAAFFTQGARAGDERLAYEDVRAAWRHYLENHNQGRPFVIYGHSQGTRMLTRLLAEEIEGSPAADRMLSALLLGFNVEVPEGKLVGGSFKRTPLCTRVGETGCVVSYVTFRATNPPPTGGLFGRAVTPGMTVACTNPATLKPGTAPLDAYWFTASPAIPGGAAPIAWSSQGAPPTPFVRTEGLASASCVNSGGLGYLSVLVNGDLADARTDRIPGDVVRGGAVDPAWGLHLADVNIALGDLIRLVDLQARAFRPMR